MLHGSWGRLGEGLLARICINNLLGLVGTQIYSSFAMRFCLSLSLLVVGSETTLYNLELRIKYANIHTHMHNLSAYIYVLIYVQKVPFTPS